MTRGHFSDMEYNIYWPSYPRRDDRLTREAPFPRRRDTVHDTHYSSPVTFSPRRSYIYDDNSIEYRPARDSAYHLPRSTDALLLARRFERKTSSSTDIIVPRRGKNPFAPIETTTRYAVLDGAYVRPRVQYCKPLRLSVGRTRITLQ